MGQAISLSMTGFPTLSTFNISLSRSSQDQMIYPRRGSAFSLSLKITPPYSLFKKEEFWKLSDAEEMAIRDDIANTISRPYTKINWTHMPKRKLQTRKIQTNTNLLNTINGHLILHGIPALLATWFFQPGRNSDTSDILMPISELPRLKNLMWVAAE